MMSKPYSEKEKKINFAVDAFLNKEYPTAGKAADAFKVPRRTVYRRINGGGSRFDRSGPGRNLSIEQEDAIVQYVERFKSCDTVPRRQVIKAAADFLLRVSHTDPNVPPPVVGKNWTTRFISRHPELPKVDQKYLPTKPNTTHDEKGFKEFYEVFCKEKASKGLLDKDTQGKDWLDPERCDC